MNKVNFQFISIVLCGVNVGVCCGYCTIGSEVELWMLLS